MSTDEILKNISSLTMSEKLLLVEDIWDSIARSNFILPLHEWQKTELDKRYKEYKDGTMMLRDWKQVHEDLRNKYK